MILTFQMINEIKKLLKYTNKGFLKKITLYFRKEGGIQILKNLKWGFINKAIFILGGFTIGVWVTRYLGPEKVGIMSYTLVLIKIFVPIQNLSGETFCVKDSIHKPKQRKKILKACFIINIFTSLFCFISLNLLSFFVVEETWIQWILALISLKFPLAIIKQPLKISYLSEKREEIPFKIKTIGQISDRIFSLILLLKKASLQFFLFGQLIREIIETIASICFSKKQAIISLWKEKTDWLLIKKYLLLSSPPFLTALIMGFNNQIDKLMVKNMIDFASVGFYEKGSHLTLLLLFFPELIRQSTSPNLFKSQKNPENYLPKMQKLYTSCFWFGLSFLTLFPFSHFIFKTLYGEAFLPSATVFQISLFLLPIRSVKRIWNSWKINELRLKEDFLFGITSLITNLLLNLLLIPSFGIEGAMFATLISQSLFLFFPIIFKKERITGKMFIMALNPFNLLKSNKELFAHLKKYKY